MGKTYWAITVLTVVCGLWIVISFSQKSVTVSKIEWTEFANVQQVTEVLQSQIGDGLESFDLVFAGPHPTQDTHIQVSEKMIRALQSVGPHILVADPLLLEKSDLKADIILNLMKEEERFLTGLRQVPIKTKVIVWAPNIYVTHLLSTSPLNRMKKSFPLENYGVLSFTNFPMDQNQESLFELPCHTGEHDTSGFSELGCFIRYQSKPYWDQKVTKGFIPGFLVQVHTKENMLFLGR